MKRVCILGAVPPPIGGVTIHIQRLIKFLKIRSNDVVFIDYRDGNIFPLLRQIIQSNIFHLNFSNKVIRLAWTLLLRILNKKVIITFHGKYNFEHYFDFWTLKLASHAFVLNNFTYNFARKISDTRKIDLISAFIPPDDKDEKLSQDLRQAIYKYSCGKDLIACTNAHSYVVDSNGNDLYGIDFLLDFFESKSNSCLIVSDPSGNLAKKYTSFNKKDNVLFISEPHSFVEVLKKSSVFIRATTSDGDSLSVKEAIYYNTKVIASDCVDRPEGCIIYETLNSESLRRSLELKHNTSDITISNGADRIMEVYNVMKNL